MRYVGPRLARFFIIGRRFFLSIVILTQPFPCFCTLLSHLHLNVLSLLIFFLRFYTVNHCGTNHSFVEIQSIQFCHVFFMLSLFPLRSFTHATVLSIALIVAVSAKTTSIAPDAITYTVRVPEQAQLAQCFSQLFCYLALPSLQMYV